MSNHNGKNKLNSGEASNGNPELSNTTYRNGNKPKQLQTASPEKYPQGRFKSKVCAMCTVLFIPKAPSEKYCSDPCKDKGHTDAYLNRVYDISYKDYEQMMIAQEGRCRLCGSRGFKMRSTHKAMLVIDHCHVTQKVRGLLCHNCNRALGLLHDDASLMRRCASYIESATTIPNGSTPK